MFNASMALATSESNSLVNETANQILGQAHIKIAHMNIRQSAMLGHRIAEVTMPKRVSGIVITSLLTSGFHVEKQPRVHCRYTIRW